MEMTRQQLLNLLQQAQQTNAPVDAKVVRSLLSQVHQLQQQVSQQQQLIQALRQEAMFDHLTGLPNRRFLEQELNRAVASAQRYSRAHALLLVDLNGFKQINDKLGHDAGDEVLKHVAHLLRRNTRPTDVVARLGGDEFCVLLMELLNEHDMQTRAESLATAIRNNPCFYNGRMIQIQAAVGGYFFDGGADAQDVLKQADENMYAHKPKNRNR